MITFTVPEALRPFIRSHQRLCYSGLFKASSDSMKKLAVDEKFIGGDLPGFFGVLHTWGRQLQYHPHIHYIVSGGAVSKRDGLWHPSRIDFYLPVKALSKIFKAKFRDEMQKAGFLNAIPPEVWQTDWNVNCQAVGNSEQTVKYLAPYIFKVAISNSRIIKVEDHKVTFRYKKHKSSRWRLMTLDVIEFIRRFLQHVLPEGFMKVRYYGFMNPTCSISLDKIATLIELSYGFNIEKTTPIITHQPIPQCPACGGKLMFRYAILSRYMSIFVDTG
jgi:hypothetical protein